MSWYKTSQEFSYESELNPLLKKFASLDQLLTKQSWRDVTHQAWGYRDLFTNEDGLFNVLYGGHIYYLSDGGYSRIGISDDTGKLFLTYNSTDRVKERWNNPEVQQLVSDIENDIQTLRKHYEETEDYKGVIEVIKGM